MTPLFSDNEHKHPVPLSLSLPFFSPGRAWEEGEEERIVGGGVEVEGKKSRERDVHEVVKNDRKGDLPKRR